MDLLHAEELDREGYHVRVSPAQPKPTQSSGLSGRIATQRHEVDDFVSMGGGSMVRFLAVICLGGTVLAPKSCSINFGGPGDNQVTGFNLSVPFFFQSAQYCGPASVEM